MEELINNLAGLFSDQDPSKLSPETFISDIGGYSSLEKLFILLMVDDVYKVILTDDDITDSTTIEDLYNVIKSRK